MSTNHNRNSLNLLLQSIKESKFLSYPEPKKSITLLLDTDREIGRDTGTPETRVGISPEQANRLIRELAKFGLSLNLVVVKGAGELAGFSDHEYEHADCQLIAKDNLSLLSSPPDVVHALKEPSPHERLIQGLFIRIGALHLVNPIPIGILSILRSKNFSSVLDGSAIGHCSYLKSGGNKTPVVASMSTFAGEIASSKIDKLYIGELPPEKRRVVVIGGGVAGQAAARALSGRCGEVVVLEINEAKIPTLSQKLNSLRTNGTRYRVQKNDPGNLDTVLNNVSGVILAQRRGVEESPHIISINQVDLMAPGAVIVDVAIDQGGSIENPNVLNTDDLAEKIKKNIIAVKEKGKILFAEANMPRAYPNEASTEHGEAILPYLIALLVLSASFRESKNVTHFLLGLPRKLFNSWDELPQTHQNNYTWMILQDLRNGIAFVNRDTDLEICNPDYGKHPNLTQTLKQTWLNPK